MATANKLFDIAKSVLTLNSTKYVGATVSGVLIFGAAIAVMIYVAFLRAEDDFVGAEDDMVGAEDDMVMVKINGET